LEKGFIIYERTETMQEIIFGAINKILPDLLYLIFFILIIWARSFLKAWLPKIENWIKAHTTAAQREIIKKLGSEAFAYAETVYREKTGADKLKVALAYFNQHMDACGLTNLSTESINAAIHRAWLEDKRKEFPVVELAETRIGGTE
jgi:hypothetical protein